MRISITYNPTTKDLLRTAYVGLRSRPLIFASSIGFFVIVPWLAALCSIAASVFGVSIKPLPLHSLVGLILIPPFAVAGFALLILFQVRGARSLQGTHIYEFSESGIYLKGPGFDNRVEWSILTRCHVSNFGWLFMTGNAPIISIPGRVLKSPLKNELQKLVNMKNVKVTGQRKPLAEPPL